MPTKLKKSAYNQLTEECITSCTIKKIKQELKHDDDSKVLPPLKESDGVKSKTLFDRSVPYGKIIRDMENDGHELT